MAKHTPARRTGRKPSSRSKASKAKAAKAKPAAKPAGGGGYKTAGTVAAASVPGRISGIAPEAVGQTVHGFVQNDGVEELHVNEDSPGSFSVTPMRGAAVADEEPKMTSAGSKVPGPVKGVAAGAVGRTVDAFIRYDEIGELHVDETSAGKFTVTPLRARMTTPSAAALTDPAKKVAKESGAAVSLAEEMVAEIAPGARTVVYIHGINNKPPASVLKCQWDRALFGQDMGDSTRMAYWVNREYYPIPSAGTCGTGDTNDADATAVATFGMRAVEVEPTIGEEIDALAPEGGKHKLTLAKIAAKVEAAALAPPSAMPGDTAPEPGEAEPGGIRAKILPLPPSWRRWLTQRITKRFLRDVNDFLFRPDRREEMEKSLRERLIAGGGPFVVVAHSQGTMVAYEVLRKLSPDQVDVRLFVTLGSPLGIQEVQDELKKWSGGKLRVPKCVKKWINVSDRLDPVAADPDISNDFESHATSGKIRNFTRRFMNPDSPKDPHSGSGYLRTAPVQHAVRAAVGTNFGQAVRDFVIARDLAAELEDADSEARREVLIQLVQPKSSRDLTVFRAELMAVIREVVPEERQFDAAIEPLQRFVSARLTRSEVERLRSRNKDYHISMVWRDAAKRALIHNSAHTVQALPASLGYGARGQEIRWAVLDTGIRADHPHFSAYVNIERQWNCVLGGPLDPNDPDKTRAPDGHGHGTHVAGIIAGQFRAAGVNQAPMDYAGMAPETKLHVYKVLDDRGIGSDSRIIKALDHIAETNERAGQLIIPGVNLSLGGAFDPTVYGCGHSPLCQELRRLWRQGVVVCVAAGNEGYVALRGAGGEEFNLNSDLSVGDPANLEECIAVGSVHKLNPHTFGISYFSSRGPTADGRIKPDCVAPGEKIVSACHRFDPKPTAKDGLPLASDVYIEMSGTSMATPHVSGIIAGYLSMRREFIGYPDKVKNVLLENCTDIGRDRYMQGAGMPNLVKMLLNS